MQYMKNIRWDRHRKRALCFPSFFLYLEWPEEVIWRIKKAYTHLAGWFVCVWYYPTQQRVLYFYEFYTRRWWRQRNPPSTRHSSSYNIFSSFPLDDIKKKGKHFGNTGHPHTPIASSLLGSVRSNQYLHKRDPPVWLSTTILCLVVTTLKPSYSL